MFYYNVEGIAVEVLSLIHAWAMCKHIGCVAVSTGIG